MNILTVLLTVIYVIIGVFIAIVVLMQEGNQQGLGSIGGMAESYWGKNKGRSMEGNLERFTKFATAAFLVLALVLNILM
ncbi:MAG: preprotein translocase subunit SecG [Clostridiales bacterium]|nr:preprotein translocase subunit SecG [Clostridiales bacterium]MDO5140272.1 preprotein translocase subunit SecG [Eubacteriales bacterium]